MKFLSALLFSAFAFSTSACSQAVTAANADCQTPTPRGAAVTEYPGYQLVWHDEFDIDGRPSSEWNYEHGFVRNEELQWYQSDNATVSDGCLVIEGRRERVKNPNYKKNSPEWRENRRYAEFTSSCLTTSESFSFQFGRMEVRAKLPVATGSWPAIWLLGKDCEWPNNGEIDVMEYYIKYGAPSILANACWGDTKQNVAVWNSSVTPFTHFTDRDKGWADKFHVWRMDWDEHFIRLYLDDELLNAIDLSLTVNRGYNGNTSNPFTAEGMKDYILLNLALGGNGGEPLLKAFPLHYYVDYVRVYQRQ
jgi:beta-glucanase (GH16 family)